MRFVGLVVAGVLVAGAACGNGEETSTGLVESSLAGLPSIDCCERHTVFVGDLDAAGDVLGLERPGPDDDEAIAGWHDPLFSPDGNEPMPSGLLSSDVFVPMGEPWSMQPAYGRLSWGRGLAEVGRFASLEHPSGPLFVAEIVVGEPDDLIDRLGPSADGRWIIEPAVGREQIVAERDGMFAISQDPLLLDAWEDDESRTLADEAVFVTLARALDDLDVYGAILAGLGESAPTLGLGFAFRDDAPLGALVFAHSDVDSARAHLETIEQLLESEPRYAELMDDTTVELSDDLVVLTYRPVSDVGVGIGWRLVMWGDPLVIPRRT